MVIPDVLRDRSLVRRLSNLGDRADDGLVDIVPRQLTDERAVDLDEIDRQRLEVVIRAVTRAEVIDRKTEAKSRELGNLLARTAHVGHGDLLGNLENDRLQRDVIGLEALLESLKQVRRLEDVAGHVERKSDIAMLCPKLSQVLQRMADDPLIDLRHEAESVRRGQKSRR